VETRPTLAATGAPHTAVQLLANTVNGSLCPGTTARSAATLRATFETTARFVAMTRVVRRHTDRTGT